jgi:hypothetical protein
MPLESGFMKTSEILAESRLPSEVLYIVIMMLTVAIAMELVFQ